MENKRLKVGIIGLGSRGLTYMRDEELFREKLELVAIADVNPAKLRDFGERYGVPEEGRFLGDEALFAAKPKLDILFISTLDRFHFDEAMKAIELGYHIFMEKPAGIDMAQCEILRKAAKASDKLICVCHELRYAPGYQFIKRMIDSGALGRVYTIQWMEQISYNHHAHSFIRGNCGRTVESSPLFLQKCSHDMDLITWFTGRHAKKVTSFAELSEFRPENAPEGAPERCTDGCPAAETCPFDAVRQYFTEGVLAGKSGWPYEMVVPVDYNPQNMLSALVSGRYGRCVYRCGSDSVDHQIVDMELEDGILVNFTMSTFTANNGRLIHIMGTRGDLICDMDGEQTITFRNWRGETTVTRISDLTDDLAGHGGGDAALVRAFAEAVLTGAPDPNLPLLEDTLESHYICLAAEESRKNGGCPTMLNY